MGESTSSDTCRRSEGRNTEAGKGGLSMIALGVVDSLNCTEVTDCPRDSLGDLFEEDEGRDKDTRTNAFRASFCGACCHCIVSGTVYAGPGLTCSLCVSRRFPFLGGVFTQVFARTGLGVGDSRTAAVVLQNTLVGVRANRKSKAHFSAIVESGTSGLDVFVRGVGRTGVPGPNIHDF